jgi:hypothetical protein
VRRSLRLLLVMAGFVPLAAPAAEVTAERGTDLSVTVYRAPSRPSGTLDLDQLDGFALVSETRTVSVPAGESRIRFAGVADGIETASAIITGLPADVLEKNRDARLLSPSALVAATLGRLVLLVRTDKKSGQQTRIPGTIRSDADGGVLFETSEGVEALRCSGLPETFSFSTDSDLAATPTLSALIRSPKPFTATVNLSYLAHGFDWTANYVATVSPDGKSMDLGAWVTLANGNGVTFQSAQTQVVAGRLNRGSPDFEPLELGQPIVAECWPRGSTSDTPDQPVIVRAIPLGGESDGEMYDVVVTAQRRTREYMAAMPIAAPSVAQLVQEEQLGDLKLYRVPEHTTLTSRQIKQVRLLERRAVPLELFYGADLQANQNLPYTPAQKTLRTRNDAAHHLGLPLPSGHIASFVAGKNATVLLDEVPLRDVAVDEEFEIGIGDSPDVQVSAVLAKSTVGPRSELKPPLLHDAERLTSAVVDDVSRIEIRNARRSAIRFELRLRLADGSQLIGADHTPTVRDGRPLFKLTIPAGGSATVRYQTEHTSLRPTRR